MRELDPALRRAARAQFAERRVEVLNNARAKEITSYGVILDYGREIASENVVWTVGGRASVMLESLNLPTMAVEVSWSTPTCASRATTTSGASMTARPT